VSAVVAPVWREIAAVPLEPDRDDARTLLLDELSKVEYAQALPSWFDRAAQWVIDWFMGVRVGEGEGVPFGLLIAGLVIIALAVASGLLIYGLPRWQTRSSANDDLFGENDTRSARELRRDASAAASRSDFAHAIADQYRALARALDERTVVALVPGTTAHLVARQASTAFPEATDALEAAAGLFDGVRYLDHPGDHAGYELVRALDERLAATSPALSDDAPRALVAPQ
jgi:hypothetical protein